MKIAVIVTIRVIYRSMDNISIPQNQIISKKKIGKKADGSPLEMVRTAGGLFVVADNRGRVMAMGPHPAVARHIAMKQNEGIQWTELSKSEHVEYAAYANIVPEWEKNTKDAQDLQNL